MRKYWYVNIFGGSQTGQSRCFLPPKTNSPRQDSGAFWPVKIRLTSTEIHGGENAAAASCLKLKRDDCRGREHNWNICRQKETALLNAHAKWNNGERKNQWRRTECPQQGWNEHCQSVTTGKAGGLKDLEPLKAAFSKDLRTTLRWSSCRLSLW